jgi:hypothetical protein
MRLQVHPDEQQVEPDSREVSLGHAEHFAAFAVPQHVCPPAAFEAQHEPEASANCAWFSFEQKSRISPVEQRQAIWGVPLHSVSGTIARIISCRRTVISDRLLHQKPRTPQGYSTSLSAKPLALNHEFSEGCGHKPFDSASSQNPKRAVTICDQV